MIMMISAKAVNLGDENCARDSRIDEKLWPGVTAGKLVSSSSTLSSTSLSSSVSPKPPAGSTSGTESSVSSVSSAWDNSPVNGTLEAETREVVFLGATAGETVDVVDAAVPWGLYSIGSNMLTGACLRCPPWVPLLGKLWLLFFFAGCRRLGEGDGEMASPMARLGLAAGVGLVLAAGVRGC